MVGIFYSQKAGANQTILSHEINEKEKNISLECMRDTQLSESLWKMQEVKGISAIHYSALP